MMATFAFPVAQSTHREWQLGECCLIVTDRITGAGTHPVEARFHLGPGLKATNLSDGGLTISDETGQVVTRMSAQGGRLRAVSSTWHPEFGASVDTDCISLLAEVELPHELTLRIDWKKC